MRVNVYAEEMTDRVELITKEIDGQTFTAVRFYLELPVTEQLPHGHAIHKGPFIHRPGDDDSSAVTFWGKQDLRPMLQKAIALLDQHYAGRTERDTQPGCHGSEQDIPMDHDHPYRGGRVGVDPRGPRGGSW